MVGLSREHLKIIGPQKFSLMKMQKNILERFWAMRWLKGSPGRAIKRILYNGTVKKHLRKWTLRVFVTFFAYHYCHRLVRNSSFPCERGCATLSTFNRCQWSDLIYIRCLDIRTLYAHVCNFYGRLQTGITSLHDWKYSLYLWLLRALTR